MKFVLAFISCLLLVVSGIKTGSKSPKKRQKKRQVISLENWQSITFLKKTSKAADVAKILEDNTKLSVDKIFSLKSPDGFLARNGLPFLKDYLKDFRKELEGLDIKGAYTLLGKNGKVLHIAQAGCKEHHECSVKIINVFEKLQDFVTMSSRSTKNLLNDCIKSLNIHKKTYLSLKKKRFDTALEYFKELVPHIKDVISKSEKIITEAGDVQKSIGEAYAYVVRDIAATQSKNEDVKNNLKQYEEKYKEFTKLIEDLVEKSQTYKDLVANKMDEEDEKICLCTDVYTTLKNSHRVKKCGLDTVHFKKNETCLLKKLRRKNLSRTKENLILERLSLEDTNLKIQQEIHRMFQKLRKTKYHYDDLLTQSKNTKISDLDISRDTLQITRTAVAFTQFQLLKMVNFWEFVLKQTIGIEEKNKNVKNAKTFQDMVLDSGFHWLAVGEAFSKMNIVLKKTREEIDNAFMTLPLSRDVKEMLNKEYKSIMSDVTELTEKLSRGIKVNQKMIHVLKRN